MSVPHDSTGVQEKSEKDEKSEQDDKGSERKPIFSETLTRDEIQRSSYLRAMFSHVEYALHNVTIGNDGKETWQDFNADIDTQTVNPGSSALILNWFRSDEVTFEDQKRGNLEYIGRHKKNNVEEKKKENNLLAENAELYREVSSYFIRNWPNNKSMQHFLRDYLHQGVFGSNLLIRDTMFLQALQATRILDWRWKWVNQKIKLIPDGDSAIIEFISACSRHNGPIVAEEVIRLKVNARPGEKPSIHLLDLTNTVYDADFPARQTYSDKAFAKCQEMLVRYPQLSILEQLQEVLPPEIGYQATLSLSVIFQLATLIDQELRKSIDSKEQELLASFLPTPKDLVNEICKGYQLQTNINLENLLKVRLLLAAYPGMTPEELKPLNDFIEAQKDAITWKPWKRGALIAAAILCAVVLMAFILGLMIGANLLTFGALAASTPLIIGSAFGILAGLIGTIAAASGSEKYRTTPAEERFIHVVTQQESARIAPEVVVSAAYASARVVSTPTSVPQSHHVEAKNNSPVMVPSSDTLQPRT